jgi:hypothetical protein
MRFKNTIWVVLAAVTNDGSWEVECAFDNELDAIKYIENEMGEDIPEGITWEDFYDIQETELK